MMIRIIKEYKKWHKNWDALCGRCGLCCYSRSRPLFGEVAIDLSTACEFLDEQTKLCKVFDERYEKYRLCGSVNLLRALFHPTLPPSCAYARTFRIWRR